MRIEYISLTAAAAQCLNHLLPTANCCLCCKINPLQILNYAGTVFALAASCRESFKDGPDKMNDAMRNESSPSQSEVNILSCSQSQRAKLSDDAIVINRPLVNPCFALI